VAQKKYGELGDELLVKQKPSRKAVKEGDIFTLKFVTGDYYFGCVVCTQAKQHMGMAKKPFLLYLYNAFSKEKSEIPDFKKENLLIAPFYGLIQDWTTGYAETVASRPLGADEVFSPHYMFSRLYKRYYDGFGNEIGPPPPGCQTPVGSEGLGNLATLDLDIREALGMAMPSWARYR
jgi:hypothetical protein